MTKEEFIRDISIEGEVWKDIEGFDGVYIISSIGRVASPPRYIKTLDGGYKTLYGKMCSMNITNSGYFIVKLWKGNEEFRPYVHKLVAKAFIDNPNDYQCIDHIDTNRLNNRAENLRWCTHSMNSLNPITRERRHLSHARNPKTQRWIIKPVVRINMFDPNDIKYYESVSATSEDGCNPSSISAVCRGNRKSYLGYYWYYQVDYERIVNKSKSSLPEGNND